MSASRAAWAVRCRGWRSSRSRPHEHEREELGVGLGDIERALDVALGPARVAEPIASDRADEQRLDEGARVQHGRGAVQHRTEGLHPPRRASPSAR